MNISDWLWQWDENLLVVWRSKGCHPTMMTYCQSSISAELGITTHPQVALLCLGDRLMPRARKTVKTRAKMFVSRNAATRRTPSVEWKPTFCERYDQSVKGYDWLIDTVCICLLMSSSRTYSSLYLWCRGLRDTRTLLDNTQHSIPENLLRLEMLLREGE